MSLLVTLSRSLSSLACARTTIRALLRHGENLFLTNQSHRLTCSWKPICQHRELSSLVKSPVVELDQADSEEPAAPRAVKTTDDGLRRNFKGKRYKPVKLETCLKYMESNVYHETYKGKPVWFYYRRNFKGHFPPPYTRSNCVFRGKLITSNPCPICRDEYLILDFRNTKLLEQFINPVSSVILETKLTGLCGHQHKKLCLEVEKAKDIGTIKTFLPFQLYDYSDYYSHLPPEQFEALMQASGYNKDVHSRVSSEDFARLPINLQDLLLSLQTIPHAEDYLIPEEETVIEKPKVPNRYKMEETYKQLVARRRKSKTLLLD